MTENYIPKDFSITFDQCPTCGSEDLLIKTLSREAKDMHIAREDWEPFTELKTFVMVDKNRMAILPVGIDIPAVEIGLDVCFACGTMFARRITRIPMHTELAGGRQPPPRFPAS